MALLITGVSHIKGMLHLSRQRGLRKWCGHQYRGTLAWVNQDRGRLDDDIDDYISFESSRDEPSSGGESDGSTNKESKEENIGTEHTKTDEASKPKTQPNPQQIPNRQIPTRSSAQAAKAMLQVSNFVLHS